MLNLASFGNGFAGDLSIDAHQGVDQVNFDAALDLGAGQLSA